jgi:hypothetical protein
MNQLEKNHRIVVTNKTGIQVIKIIRLLRPSKMNIMQNLKIPRAQKGHQQVQMRKNSSKSKQSMR